MEALQGLLKVKPMPEEEKHKRKRTKKESSKES